MNEYAFSERLRWAEGYMTDGIARILKARIPACYDIKRADTQSDKSGTDYWALRQNGLPALSIDVKVRSEDYALKGKDDLALETWSVVGYRPGWTRDSNKRTDYILWYWTDTGRFFIVAFPALCKVFQEYWERWRSEYPTFQQSSGAWESECVFVPRAEVMRKVVAWSSGVLPRSEHE